MIYSKILGNRCKVNNKIRHSRMMKNFNHYNNYHLYLILHNLIKIIISLIKEFLIENKEVKLKSNKISTLSFINM